MQSRILGRTGLTVCVMGLGCGGHSRLGLATGKTQSEAADIVRRALALGVNFIDTAESYGTEPAVAEGLEGTARESVALSTKVSPRIEDRLRTAAEIKEAVESRLRQLRTDYLDILHLHGVSFDDYPYVLSEQLPAVWKLQEEGKVRFTGITEVFASDPAHRMLVRALEDDVWDVMMVGFNFLNQSARERVLARAQERNIGILCMFAVRRALNSPEGLEEALQELTAQGVLNAEEVERDHPLRLLPPDDPNATLPDMAYRFCRDEPGIHVVLSGTGNPAHLEENAVSLSRPASPPHQVETLKRLFRNVDCISGN